MKIDIKDELEFKKAEKIHQELLNVLNKHKPEIEVTLAILGIIVADALKYCGDDKLAREWIIKLLKDLK